MEWSPILTGDDRIQADYKVRQIADIIFHHDFKSAPPDLMYGSMGAALFLYHYWQWSQDEEYYEKASDLLTSGLSLSFSSLYYFADPQEVNSSFANGISGFGWVVDYLIRHEFIEGDVEDIMDYADGWVFRKTVYDILRNHDGFLDGAAGAGLYSFIRKTRFAKEYLRRFVRELHDRYARHPETFGASGFSIPTGMSGLVLLLQEISAAYGDIGYAQSMAHTLADRLLDSQPGLLDSGCGFPEEIAGWGAASFGSLLVLSRDDRYGREAVARLAEYGACQRERLDASGLNRGLQGGPASLGHVYNRLYHSTGQPVFGELSRFFFRQLLSSASYEDPEKGHAVWLTGSKGFYQINYGLLDGLSGIGLALLAALSGDEPDWDRCLLLSR